MCKLFNESGNSPNSIINHLNVYGYLLYYDGKIKKFQDIYCGMTNDLEATLARHKIKSYLCAVDCGTKEKASIVETRMGDLGYDIGNPPHDANGATENSKYVYIFVKTEESDPALK